MLGRVDELIHEEDAIEGDVLILNPDKIGKHMPDLPFDK